MEFLAMFIACSSAALMLFLSFPFATAMHYNVPAMFIFGDSLADAGTNNFIANTTSKANFPPYGETFFHHPTGRFTNGRTAFDFIATELRLPFPPPYLKPRSDFSRGINFASGGSGLLDSTGNYLNIIPLSLQIRQFANYSSRLGKKLGGDYYAKEYLSHSLYTINSGGNDVGLNYLANTTFQNSTTAQDFVKLLLSKYNEHLLSLYNKGARKFIVISGPVVGCTPNSRLAGVKAYNGGCVETANQLVVAFNDGLRLLVNQVLKTRRLRAVERGHLTLLCLVGWRFQRRSVENTKLFFANVQRNTYFGMEPIPLRKSMRWFLTRFGKGIHPSSHLSISKDCCANIEAEIIIFVDFVSG